jgi:hypothetical protein
MFVCYVCFACPVHSARCSCLLPAAIPAHAPAQPACPHTRPLPTPAIAHTYPLCLLGPPCSLGFASGAHTLTFCAHVRTQVHVLACPVLACCLHLPLSVACTAPHKQRACMCCGKCTFHAHCNAAAVALRHLAPARHIVCSCLVYHTNSYRVQKPCNTLSVTLSQRARVPEIQMQTQSCT